MPDTTTDDLGLPELTFLFATDLAALDHETGEIWLIANAANWDDLDERVDEAWADAVRRLDAMQADLAQPTPSYVVHADRQARLEPVRQRSSAEYREAVEHAKEEIRAGEAFQIVVSQRFELASSASALDIYRVLRFSNPSPYMYLVRLDGFDIVGSSPEALVKVTDGKVILHPIAGTRRRGTTPEEDHALEQELRADLKERAEHLMLVDLGRNDVGRVCAPGTVEVVDFMDVRRYSHVMHLESTVTGTLAAGRTAFDALTAAFPAGTLSGAPKPRAMEIIDKLEVSRRGVYGGVVGYLDFAGDADTAIAIRTAVLRAGTAYVQAGAGTSRPRTRSPRTWSARRRPPPCCPRSPSPRPSTRSDAQPATGRRPGAAGTRGGRRVGVPDVGPADPGEGRAVVELSGYDVSRAPVTMAVASLVAVVVLRLAGTGMRRVLCALIAAMGAATGAVALATRPDAAELRGCGRSSARCSPTMSRCRSDRPVVRAGGRDRLAGGGLIGVAIRTAGAVRPRATTAIR